MAKEENKKSNAQFSRCYCKTEGKELSGWNSDHQVAVNAKNHHLTNNPSHTVSIETQ